LNSTTRLGERLHQLKQSDADVFMSFDKDDDDALNFVTSAANLRAHMFGIELKSRFDVKCE
jgi:ubiquitin-like 1-activating enzyme E1 B